MDLHKAREEEEEFAESEENIDHGKAVTLALYNRLVTYENHYNVLQNRYKHLAITWVLATFVGVGYLLSGFEEALPIDVTLAVMFLCLFAAQGIFLIWFLDLGVYFKMLSVVFYEILAFEKKYNFILQTHHNVVRAFKSPDTEPLNFHSLFYLIFVIFLLLISVTSLIIYLYPIHPKAAIIGLGCLICGLIAFGIAHKKILRFLTNLKK